MRLTGMQLAEVVCSWIDKAVYVTQQCRAT